MNILAIDPGSTSTKIGVHVDGELNKTSINHKRELIDSFENIIDQKNMRFEVVNSLLQKEYGMVKFDAVIGRGGLVKPIKSGVYAVNNQMLHDLKNGISGHHASNLGGILAYEFGKIFSCASFIADPVVVDEMDSIAKLSGFREIERKSIFHALNHKSAALKAAEKAGKPYEELNLIVAHMGGGISIGAHKKGSVVDVNNALDGDGPFAVERTGSLPVGDLIRLIKNKKYTADELLSIFSKKGGVYSYLNTTDMISVEKDIEKGNEHSRLVVEALIYQISKEIGALAAALNGSVDAIVLTGGLAKSRFLVESISKKVEFIAQIFVFGGEFEIETLVDLAKKALLNKEIIKTYQ
jgi:butyrate kinase